MTDGNLTEQRIFLLLGANLGDRRHTLVDALEQITQRVGPVISASSFYETAPWGVTDQPSYLNQVLEVRSLLAPHAVLTTILDIERLLGRVRLERWGARLVDIDLLYYDQQMIDTPDLTVPHPRLHLRRFTLAPLAEIAPEFLHAGLQKSNRQLLEECEDDSEVVRLS